MKKLKIVCLSIVCIGMLSGCIGKIVAFPFKVIGDVVETVLP